MTFMRKKATADSLERSCDNHDVHDQQASIQRLIQRCLNVVAASDLLARRNRINLFINF